MEQEYYNPIQKGMLFGFIFAIIIGLFLVVGTLFFIFSPLLFIQDRSVIIIIGFFSMIGSILIIFGIALMMVGIIPLLYVHPYKVQMKDNEMIIIMKRKKVKIPTNQILRLKEGENNRTYVYYIKGKKICRYPISEFREEIEKIIKDKYLKNVPIEKSIFTIYQRRSSY